MPDIMLDSTTPAPAARTLVLAGSMDDTFAMTLLEREASLAALAGYADEARAGDGRLLLVAGEAGVGKSALVEQFARQCADARWFWGACDGLFTPRPLAPLFDLAAQLGGEVEELSRAGADREDLFRALLRQITKPAVLTVVVVEDIHWADEATLDMVRFLARRVRNTSVLLIATYRDEGLALTDPLRRGLGELVTQGVSSRVELSPLSLEAVRTLAAPLGLPANELYELTGGNPFYVTEVLRTGTEQIPPTTRDVILSRVARLDADCRQALEAAALIGARVDVELFALVAALPDRLIDDLLVSGLLVTDGPRLRFRHEIARRTVEQSVPLYRRGAVHARILAALLATGCDDDARLAFHAEEADDAPAVLHHAPRAALRAAELYAHSEAAAQYQRALRFGSRLEPAQLATYYDRLFDELALVDRWPEAADAGEHARELWRAVGDPLREGDALRRLVKAQWRLCRGREASAAGEEALAILEPLGPTVELAWAYANAASERLNRLEPEDAIALTRRAQSIAESLGAFEVQSSALNTEGCATAIAGRDWVTPLERALEVALEHGCEEQAGRAYTNLHELYSSHARFAEGHRYYTEGIAYSDVHDMGTYARCLRGGYAVVLMRTGDWQQAEAIGRDLLDHCDPNSINRVNPLLCLGTIGVRRGAAGAVDLLDEFVAAAEGASAPEYIASARLARAEAYWLVGNVELARRQVELADDVASGCDNGLRGAVAAWLRRVGSERPARGEIIEPHRSEVAGDWSRAAELWNDLGCTYDAALAQLETADENALRQALATFEELGATATSRLTRQTMRALGIRSIPSGRRSTTRAHPLGLTQREREVLELICDCFTNAEIAAELVISIRTVDHHVSAILTKLGAPTRTDAAKHAVQLGLVAS
jgi:DNA-binding CsgD family transcriptional regulator/tetratricopeptide (TPR) repeat protein